MACRGVVRGKLATGERELRPCVLMADAYPMWLPVVKRLGFKPVLVLLKTEQFLTVVESQVAEECAIIASHNLEVLAASTPAKFVHSEAVLFLDGRVTQFALDLSELMQIQVVLGQGRPQRHPRGWWMHTSTQEHQLCGGVSHTRTPITTCVRLSSRPVETPSIQVPATCPRDMSTLLSPMVASKYRRAPPSKTHLKDFEVCNVRAHNPRARNNSTPVYHGGGWLPANPSLSTQILTPYALAAPRWVIRTLDPAEYLQVYDFPVSMVPTMLPVVSSPQSPTLVPGASLFYGAIAGFAAMESMHNGGGVIPFLLTFIEGNGNVIRMRTCLYFLK